MPVAGSFWRHSTRAYVTRWAVGVAGPTTTIPVVVDGVALEVEATRVAGTQQTSSMDRAQDAVADAFDRAQDGIVAVAASTVATIGRLGARALGPDEVRVKFGLKFTAKGSVIVAGASGEATLEVSLTYQAAPAPTTPASVAASATDGSRGYLGARPRRGGCSVGTCFQLDPAGIVVTAWHVLDDLGAGDVGAAVSVDPLRRAVAARAAEVAGGGSGARPGRAALASAVAGDCVAGLAATDEVASAYPGVDVTGVVGGGGRHTYRHLDAAG